MPFFMAVIFVTIQHSYIKTSCIVTHNFMIYTFEVYAQLRSDGIEMHIELVFSIKIESIVVLQINFYREK